ncbi:hypothetical protein QJU83_02325 [Pasteurella skyensis]|uniref:hypothetical protein n=1 Tax=Phocoenobacter skyensis TaxID=97481 RepID=UPI0027572F2F|nr:hypothetical protein [Pasteurella skyensis]MDP8176379.1 hypothetical protein [Pasteurella skyensis]MDP8199108.1 hypothetical protein [Pasteurella skyensis]
MSKPNRRKQRNLQWRFHRNTRKHRPNTLLLNKKVRALTTRVDELEKEIQAKDFFINDLMDAIHHFEETFKDVFTVINELEKPFLIRIWKKVFAK